MRPLIMNSATIIWLVLIVATATSWWLGTSDTTNNDHHVATITLMLLTFFKARLVLMHFMEVRTAPIILRTFANAWIALTCIAVLIIYMWGANF